MTGIVYNRVNETLTLSCWKCGVEKVINVPVKQWEEYESNEYKLAREIFTGFSSEEMEFFLTSICSYCWGEIIKEHRDPKNY